MKVIDLLNKIANGEEVPKRIKIYQDYYIWYDNEMTGNVGYCKEPLQSDGNSFLTINTLYDLNYEIEIIEEDKKIEKITNMNCIDAIDSNCYEEYSNKAIALDINTLRHKINKIIDYLEDKQC